MKPYYYVCGVEKIPNLMPGKLTLRIYRWRYKSGWDYSVDLKWQDCPDGILADAIEEGLLLSHLPTDFLAEICKFLRTHGYGRLSVRWRRVENPDA